MIDHTFQRLLARRSRRHARLKVLNLPIRAGTPRQDGAGVLELGAAAERCGILGEYRQQFIDEIAEGDELALAEVEQGPLHAVALRAPAVLGQEEQRIGEPGVLGASAWEEHAREW